MTLLAVVALGAVLMFLLFTAGNSSARTSNEKNTEIDPANVKVAEVTNTPGTFEWNVVGEGHYQDALALITGGKTEEGHNMLIDALLVPEDDNPHDPLAYCVRIKGHRVGYMSREDARTLREKVKDTNLDGVWLKVPAMIRGGWRHSPEDQGMFGVVFDLPTGEDTADKGEEP